MGWSVVGQRGGGTVSLRGSEAAGRGAWQACMAAGHGHGNVRAGVLWRWDGRRTAV
jgi:hypothetical protein